jgi:hypothetical protein
MAFNDGAGNVMQECIRMTEVGELSTGIADYMDVFCRNRSRHTFGNGRLFPHDASLSGRMA